MSDEEREVKIVIQIRGRDDFAAPWKDYCETDDAPKDLKTVRSYFPSYDVRLARKTIITEEVPHA